ncbi:efflux RND transporter periplasmic adaptor subunit [Arenibacter aquaticus]|uniref:Efflux RND transporter periplasmic adaptor subunit n=1 Tax=Arenibacter aquaticus TaxID=2489054 RepID=A0A3S0IMZ3_9FLAO|nr:efflux RND transporter periplasmic adaptor subunit [Arenibacter aquaticus]
MKKNILYIVIAALGGVIAGYLIFGMPGDTTMDQGHTHSEEMVSDGMWTCSMHPQIMQKEPGDCPICGMDLIPTETDQDGLSVDQFKMTRNALALADVRTTKIGSANTEDSNIKLSGVIQQNEKTLATQASYFDGRIEQLYVNFKGEKVEYGQQLATIYSPDLVAAQQELITAGSLKESQPALYEAVRNKLKLWKLSERQINQIEESGRVRENFPIYSNISGTVSEIMVKTGDYVKKGAPIFKIADLGTVWAVFDAYENQLSLLKKGQEIIIYSKAYPNKKFNAKISFIDPILNTKSRTVEVRADLQNPKDQLKPGMFVSGLVDLPSSSKEGRIVVPESAVMWTGERSLVYVKTDPNEPIFEMREIALGNIAHGGYIVHAGLTDGDEIVTNGTFTVDAAAQLQGKKSMMNKNTGTKTNGHVGH